MNTDELKIMIDDAYRLLNSGDLDSAFTLYNKIIAVDAGNLAALNSIGFILYFRNEFAQGIEICRKTVELYPDNAYARKGLAMHLAKAGFFDEAVMSMKKAIEIRDDFVDAYHDLAYIYYEASCFEDAKKYLLEGLAKVKDQRYKALFEKFLNKLNQISGE